MASFLNKLRASTGNASPASASSPAKKDPNTPLLTPLEKLLLDAGPIRNDGSDKFFGMENFGNTCYCNSILQCLYYSVPFREQVINYPRRTPLETINTDTAEPSKLNTNLPNGQSQLSPNRMRSPPTSPSTRSPGGSLNTPKPEDKDSPEYKKKQAMLTGPILPMNRDNSAAYGMTESLFTSLKDMFESMIANPSRTGVVSPDKFLEVLRKENEMFRSAMHQDAHEFLNILLNEVVTNVDANSKRVAAEKEKPMNGSIQDSFEKALAHAMPANTTGTRPPGTMGWVHELFEGTLTSETKCLTCENVSHRDEAFLDLSVDLDQHSSVTSCLRKFSEEEMLCERNKFHCDMCGGLQEAEKRMKIKRLPRILALHLKRFKYTEDLQRLQKLFHRVVYPYQLRLFNTTDDAEDPDRLYELYAVVVHIGGGPYYGHYVSIIKTQDRGWLLFDDEMVEPVDKSYVRNFFGDRPGLACAYVLFYQETTLEAVKREQEAEGFAKASQASAVPKELVGLGLNSNGELANRNSYRHSAFMSRSEEPAQMKNLDKAMTAPAIPTQQQPEEVPSAPIITPPDTPELKPVQTDLPIRTNTMSKKERKAIEKEKEVAEKARRRDLEVKRQEHGKDQARKIAAAVQASKVSKAEEDQKLAAGSGSKENGTVVSPNTMAAGLSRFRKGSKSISRRSKFWSSKDSSKEDEAIITEQSEDQHPPTPVPVPVSAPAPTPAPTPEKMKSHRFSIRKKSSSKLV